MLSIDFANKISCMQYELSLPGLLFLIRGHHCCFGAYLCRYIFHSPVIGEFCRKATLPPPWALAWCGPPDPIARWRLHPLTDWLSLLHPLLWIWHAISLGRDQNHKSLTQFTGETSRASFDQTTALRGGQSEVKSLFLYRVWNRVVLHLQQDCKEEELNALAPHGGRFRNTAFFLRENTPHSLLP